MAHLRFSRKKNVAKRAWKSFTNILKSKVKGLQIATSVRDSTSRLLHVIPRRTSPRAHLDNYYSHSLSPRQRSRFLECFSQPFAKKKCLRRHTSERNYLKISEYQSQLWTERAIKSEENVLEEKKEEEEEMEKVEDIVDSMEDVWRRVVDASPHLRVDERAGEFIHKFKKELRMEKEKSLIEFKERLIRSA